MQGFIIIKEKKNNEGAGVVDLDSPTMSSLEDSEEEFDFLLFVKLNLSLLI